MQDLIVALYGDPATAANVRTELVKDGLPTDRVELTSPHEHRQVDRGPADGFETRLRDYFRALCADATQAHRLNQIAQAVIDGASAITVHPRGEEEIRRVENILARHHPREMYRYLPQDAAHVADRKLERAASGRAPEHGS